MLTITEAKAAFDAAIDAHGEALKKMGRACNASPQDISDYLVSFNALRDAELLYIRLSFRSNSKE